MRVPNTGGQELGSREVIYQRIMRMKNSPLSMDVITIPVYIFFTRREKKRSRHEAMNNRRPQNTKRFAGMMISVYQRIKDMLTAHAYRHIASSSPRQK